MSDLPYIQQAIEAKITGQNASGTTSNFVQADSSGNMFVKDAADGADGSTAPTFSTQIAGKDVSGNLQTLVTDTNGNLIISSRIALTGSSPTAASVGVTSGIVIAANTSRRGLVLTNTSSAIVSFNIAGGSAVLRSGITLLPGGTFVMDEFTYTTSAIDGIASAAASNIAIQELT